MLSLLEVSHHLHRSVQSFSKNMLSVLGGAKHSLYLDLPFTIPFIRLQTISVSQGGYGKPCWLPRTTSASGEGTFSHEHETNILFNINTFGYQYRYTLPPLLYTLLPLYRTLLPNEGLVKVTLPPRARQHCPTTQVIYRTLVSTPDAGGSL